LQILLNWGVALSRKARNIPRKQSNLKVDETIDRTFESALQKFQVAATLKRKKTNLFAIIKINIFQVFIQTIIIIIYYYYHHHHHIRIHIHTLLSLNNRK
jgi:hypothetical protein